MSNIFRNLDWSVLTGALFSVIPALICITLHELSHGFVAYKLGDPTAKDLGRLTLNPIKHIDLVGLVMMVIFKFGWAKPVPVSMRNFKRPKQYMAITALAGPITNFLIAIAFIVLFGLLYTPLSSPDPSVKTAGNTVLEMINQTAYISTALAVFNLVPIPPLDGSKVLFSLMPDKAYEQLMRYERYGMILLIIFISTNAFDSTVGRITMLLFNKLITLALFVFQLVN